MTTLAKETDRASFRRRAKKESAWHLVYLLPPNPTCYWIRGLLLAITSGFALLSLGTGDEVCVPRFWPHLFLRHATRLEKMSEMTLMVDTYDDKHKNNMVPRETQQRPQVRYLEEE
ncbi:hypothetical protein BJV77DRAFT_961058 [Russula vinacea]|nr:hypothetical protein BJV77DRAFT_961058 [Russula vinacea]